MINISSLILAAMLAAPGQPTVAAGGTTPDVEAATAKAEASAGEAEEANDDNKVICRRTQIIGSKFKKRVCGTRAEWESLSRKSKDKTDTMQRRGRGREPDTR